MRRNFEIPFSSLGLLVLLCLFIAGCDEDCDPIVMLFTRIMGGDEMYSDNRILNI